MTPRGQMILNLAANTHWYARWAAAVLELDCDIRGLILAAIDAAIFADLDSSTAAELVDKINAKLCRMQPVHIYGYNNKMQQYCDDYKYYTRLRIIRGHYRLKKRDGELIMVDNINEFVQLLAEDIRSIEYDDCGMINIFIGPLSY